MILHYLDYYFSDINLETDDYLKGLMNNDGYA